MKRTAAVIAILVLCSNVHATLVELDNAPEWRTGPAGQDSTTYQAWEFTNNPGGDLTVPIAPDVGQNDFGGATLSVTDNSITTVWMPGYGRPGVIKLMNTDKMVIDIGNTGNNGPDTWKEIWLQIIYADPGGNGFLPVPILTDPIYEYANFDRKPLENLGDGYFLDTYSIILEPNPSREIIEIMSLQENIYISAISVDTRCVPEPTTICLFGVGVLGLLRKRRA